MTVVNVTQDPEALTLTVVAELAAPPARVWQIWSDARQLEQWWGPPTWPATFYEHALSVGATCRYYMTGPEGEKAGGWWRITALDGPRSLAFEDGFADESGEPNDAMPTTTARVLLEETGAGTRMTVTSQFATLEQMLQLAEMGMVEGMTLAAGQIDAVLAA